MAYTLLQQTIYAWFHQIPKEEAAIFALVVFFLIGVANLVITCRTKAWFMLTVAFTAALEVAGYAFRITMLHKPAYGPFVAMQALLIIPPIFLALVDYSAVGKLMRLAGGGGRLNPAWVARFFFASDILCLAIQGAGAGLSSSMNGGDQNSAKALLIVGLILQLFFFTCFTGITIYINLNKKYGLRGIKQCQPIFICLYVTIALMYIRSIFRLIEFADGWYGPIASNEVYFYVLDFLMIFLCSVVFTVLHFGVHLKKAELALVAVLPVTAPHMQGTETTSMPPKVAGKPSDASADVVQIQALAA
ncbi:hypothetical protein ABBQ38_013868 [Trebouxia sp. C0009 RCD-2024]